eukprot:GSChrysophyteH1.ASY1.ANO1.1392.1 assembled CDS
MLDYDQSAFYYFALTLVLCYLIPATYGSLKEIIYALFGSSEKYSARTLDEVQKISSMRENDSGISRLKKRRFLLNLFFVIIGWTIFFYLNSLVETDGTVQSFDPFQILGVEHGADDKVIKKAYRKLSLQYHPDKNIGSKVAEEMFMKIAKAYEALTDEVSKENFQKYGNPDGKQAMEISIGLPRWILDNPKAVLLLYLVGMVVVIPLIVGIWYNNSKKFGEKNIEYETYKAYYVLMKPNTKLRNLPEILCCSAEFRRINDFRPEDKASISKLMGNMQNKKLMERPLYDKQPNILKGNLLLHAHLYRMTDQLSPSLKNDLKEMLKIAPDYIDTMVEIARQRGWLEATLQCIRFTQCIKQGLFRNADPLKQLPHLSNDALKEIAKESQNKVSSLKEFLMTPDEDKRGLGQLTAEQRKDVITACSILPCRKTKVELYVEDNEDTSEGDSISGKDIYEGDLVTIRLSIERVNERAPEEAKEAEPIVALAPFFPLVTREKMWVILTNKDRHHMLPTSVGDYAMQLYIVSDTYLGLDEAIDVKFSVLPASDLPEYEPHPEDAQLDNEPTLFEQVLSANADEADSSDDDEEPINQKQMTDADSSDNADSDDE